MTGGQAAILLAASVGAGVMNSMAGGGTLLTFPALLLTGESAIQANATSTVALLPGAASSMAAYRDEVAAHRDWLKTLLLPSLAGGLVGALLLLRTPEQTFRKLAPILILFATLLFAFQALVARPAGEPQGPAKPRRLGVAVLAQFLVSVYGGYFGAGIGILMLVILGFLGLSDIHAMNGLKNFFGICINVTAALLFVVNGAVDWGPALLMAAGSTVGGYGGARFARRIGQKKARAAVIVIGLVMGISLLVRQ